MSRSPRWGGTDRDPKTYGFIRFGSPAAAFVGGTVHGATDEFGFKAVENPTSVHDLHATMVHDLGFGHEKLNCRYAGRDFRLTDVHGNVIERACFMNKEL